ncbi:MAG: TetR family transcriptional regulator [Salinibacterium sp.]|nr:TetR family transcriptional regulator [Salinibacterium sp.]
MLVTNIWHVTSTKTELTRARLLATALELFAEQGYEQTTVAQIAARASVSEMTFFRYFPAKEDLLLDDPYDPLMVAAVAQQPRDLPPLTRAVRGIRAAWHSLPVPDSADVRNRVRIIANTPSLRASMWRNAAETEQVIAQALGDGLASRVAAAAAIAALNTALLEWGLGSGDLGELIDEALDVLEASDD